MYQHILAAIDGSDSGWLVADEAVRFAADQRASLRFIHVVDEGVVYWGADGVILDSVFDTLRRSGQAILDRAAAAASQAGLKAETLLRETVGKRLPDVIIAEAAAWPADLLVLGAHGRSGVGHLLLGSVSESVVRRSPVPVLLVRGRTEAAQGTPSPQDAPPGSGGR